MRTFSLEERPFHIVHWTFCLTQKKKIMKTYWDIPGPSKAPQLPCTAFYKLDGSNMRFGWSRKRGWDKFGTRYTVFDETSEQWGHVIPQFMEKLAEDIEKVFRENKNYRGIKEAIVFCEHFGPSSFAGWHDYDELKRVGELVIIDVNVHKKGFVLPNDFIKDFGHLNIPQVVYQGNFNKQFVQDVREGKYDQLREGVVVKGVNLKNKRAQHGLWMSKVKTKWWLAELKARAQTDAQFRKVLIDNIKEQEDNR